MTFELADKIVGYHYTNEQAYKSIRNKGMQGYFTKSFDNFTGLIPNGRFIKLYGNRCRGLPEEATSAVIEGLLEPEPKQWLENSSFPHLWRYLMSDICRTNKVILLSFELNQNDKAYVVERANAEGELYSNNKNMNKGFRKYWKSRTPVLEYEGGYTLPQLAIWSGIEFERLNVEWVKPSRQVWQRIIDNNW